MATRFRPIHNGLAQIIWAQTKSVLGTVAQPAPLSPAGLFDHETDLIQTGFHFTLEEIHKAIMDLPRDKASGPNGLPNEFFHTFFLPALIKK
jgi:hypothetical protein